MPKRNKFRFGPTAQTARQPVLADVILVWIQCKQSRCLAYQNANGQWVNFYTGKVVTDFVDIIG
ncbi:MAG: hypothetical protein WAO02_16390 [Verrucomicrobiia bacterium]